MRCSQPDTLERSRQAFGVIIPVGVPFANSRSGMCRIPSAMRLTTFAHCRREQLPLEIEWNNKACLSGFYPHPQDVGCFQAPDSHPPPSCCNRVLGVANGRKVRTQASRFAAPTPAGTHLVGRPSAPGDQVGQHSLDGRPSRDAKQEDIRPWQPALM
jgi:hypothetical protein